MLTSGMPVVKAAGRSLSYEWIEGDGRARPTLVFLHEGLGSIRQWRDFPLKVVAATGCRALVYDRYGYGQSDVLEEPRRSVRFMHDEALVSLPELRGRLGIDDAILRAVEIALTPFVEVARRVTAFFAPRPTGPADTERDDLEDLLREGELEGVGEKTEMAIISGVVQFGHKTLSEIMTPRSDVFAIDEQVRGPERALLISQSRYSRVPIYRDTLDNVIETMRKTGADMRDSYKETSLGGLAVNVPEC